MTSEDGSSKREGATETRSETHKAGSGRWLELLKVIMMPLVTLVLGFVVNSSLDARHESEDNLRVYTEMMGKREEADSTLRKDMFQSILTTFLSQNGNSTDDQHLDEQILKLELLASNFHESIDLAPLFKHVRQRIPEDGNSENAERVSLLEKVALEVKEREVTVLTDSGSIVKGDAELQDLKDGISALRVPGDRVARNIDPETAKKLGQCKTGKSKCYDPRDNPIKRLCLANTDGERNYRQFVVEIIDHKPLLREARVRLYVSRPLTESECGRADLNQVTYREIDTTFWVGLFDFPMTDNTHLTHGERCAVTITMMTSDLVQLTLAYFPGSRASLKDKPYYDEMMHDLVHAKKSTTHSEE
ncbi:MAG TPA: hypothetical protein VE422_32730 [Terriglobia bacterium]|nr:hypothetical protein [Terriglobia bacterium]